MGCVRRRTPPLERLLDAIAIDPSAALALIRAQPELAHERVVVDRFVDAVAHWIYEGDTPLHLAAAALEPDMVAALLGAGADPNAENRRGALALHYACDPRPHAGRAWDGAEQRKVIALLVDAGARIDHVEKAGATPLHRAVRARSPEAVQCLLELGASVHARHAKQGSTPLHLALRSTGASGTKGTREEQDAIAALLLKHGADPLAEDANGKRPPALPKRAR